MLLDSVIVIDYLNALPQAVSFIEGNACTILVVTFSEVMAGVEGEPAGETSAFLRSFRVLGIDAAIAERAGRLRRTERWKLPTRFRQRWPSTTA